MIVMAEQRVGASDNAQQLAAGQEHKQKVAAPATPRLAPLAD